jgi:hypothetical protein
MLNGFKASISSHYKGMIQFFLHLFIFAYLVQIRDSALVTVARLSDRYRKNQLLQDTSTSRYF